MGQLRQDLTGQRVATHGSAKRDNFGLRTSDSTLLELLSWLSQDELAKSKVQSPRSKISHRLRSPLVPRPSPLISRYSPLTTRHSFPLTLHWRC
jgi:hypothetical protein